MPGPLADYPVTVTIPVRWGDMDAMGHVNNTVYFRFFESSRVAFFERMASHTTRATGIAPILHSVSCRFRAPVTFPDTVVVGARVVEVGEDRFRMAHELYSEQLDLIAARGEALIVSYDYEKAEKAPLPDAWRAHIESLQG